MANTNEEIQQALLEAIRISRFRDRFSPRIYQSLGLEIDERSWLETLSKLAQSGTLITNYEVVDPVSKKTIDTCHSMWEVPIGEVFSDKYPFVVSEEDVYLTYSFAEAQTNVS